MADGLRQKLLLFKRLKLSQGTDGILIGLLGKLKGLPVAADPAESVGQIISQISHDLTHQYPDQGRAAVRRED